MAQRGPKRQVWPGSPAIPHLQTRVAFLPYGPKILKSLKPVPYEREPKTLGQHLKKRRLELGLRQRDIADNMGVNTWTYLLWEQNKTKPEVRYWPKIILFLGFDPSPTGVSLSEKLKVYRRRHGLSQAKLAMLLGVDEASIGDWEKGVSNPSLASQAKLLVILS